jgi:protein-L-isoaspartate(D-aspartate) O-methyltransferase
MAYSNQDLIKELVELGYLKSQRLIDAFSEIDRKDFVPEELSDFAYHNEPLPIGFEQTISQPLTVAFMLELLELKPQDKVLEIGSGSGWQTALIAKIIGDSQNDSEDNQKDECKIVALERIPQLKEMTERNLSKYGFLKKGIVKVILADGTKGYPDQAPYDKIIAAASAKEIPKEWKEQLKIGGRIVAPVKNEIVVLEKTGKNDFEQKSFWGFSFVPLVSD